MSAFCLAFAQRTQTISNFSQNQSVGEGVIPDTTELRWMGFSDGGEIIFFNSDTTNLIYEEAITGSGSSYHAIFQHPDGRLIVMIDSAQGVGERDYYEFQPFLRSKSLVQRTNAAYLASACVLPNGRIFSITGNGNSAPGYLYEQDFSNGTDSLLMQLPYASGNPVNIVYRPSTDELLVFNGAIDSVFVIDYNNKTFQQVSANLLVDGTLKATYLDGENLVIASNDLYNVDLTQGYDLSLSPTTLIDYLSDLDNLDLIIESDSVFICAGDSGVLTSRFQSPYQLWYQDGLPTTITSSALVVNTPGTYRLLVQMDTTGLRFMWSEEVTVIQNPAPAPVIGLGSDTVQVGQSVQMSNNGTTGVATWDLGNGFQVIGNNISYTYLTAGTFVVSLTVDLNGCLATVLDTIVVLPTVSNELAIGSSNLNLIVAPNPVNEEVRISVQTQTSGSLQLEIVDMLGKRVAILQNGSVAAGTMNFQVPTLHLPDGIYFVKVNSETERQVAKLVVSH